MRFCKTHKREAVFGTHCWHGTRTSCDVSIYVEDTGDLYRLNLEAPTVGTYDEVTERMKSLGVLVRVGEEPVRTV